jgi:anti-sigma B factor antagonist
MKMEIKTRRIGTSLVLDVTGQVKGGDAADLRTNIKHLQDEGELDLLINLQDVGFIDSSGVGMLIHCLQEVRSRGGDLRLLRLSEDIHDLFEMVAIDRLFTIYQTEEEIVPLRKG